MSLILCACALHLFCQRPLNWTSLIKIIFRLNMALKPWLVCMTSYAIILLHHRVHFSKIYSLIFLHVCILMSSIMSPTNTPGMMNQSTLLTLFFLHFIPTLQLTFSKNFYIFLTFSCNSKFLPQRRALDIKGSPAENDRRHGRQREGPTLR